jgi:hypothetical protein
MSVYAACSHAPRRSRPTRRREQVTDLAGALQRQLDGHARAGVRADDVDLAQAERVDDGAVRGRILGDRERLRRRVGLSIARSVERDRDPIVAHLGEKGLVRTAGVRGLVEAHERPSRPLVGSALRRWTWP